MKTKSKRIILSLTTLVLNLSVFTTISSAQVTTSQPLSINENFVENKTQDSTITFAQIIGWRYKSENGKVYNGLENGNYAKIILLDMSFLQK